MKISLKIIFLLNVGAISFWAGLYIHSKSLMTQVQQVEHRIQTHQAHQKLLEKFKLDSPAPPGLSSQELRKRIRKIGKQYGLRWKTLTLKSPPNRSFTQFELHGEAFLEDDVFIFLDYLLQTPGFLGFQSFKLEKCHRQPPLFTFQVIAVWIHVQREPS